VTIVVLAFAGFTWWALESSGVAVVETHRPDGSTRSTHVWYVVNHGQTWLEAGTPENGWFRDVETSPHVVLTIDGRATEYVAEPIREPSGHVRIRAMMRAKYGIRDRWIALIFATSRSILVRLSPSSSA
jgi:hypothetical protein